MHIISIEKIFSKNTVSKQGLVYCFGNERDGDFFDEEDFNIWNNNDLYSQRSTYLLNNKASRFLIDNIVKDEDFIVDLATGSSMGFIPAIKQKSAIHCVASDAR